MLTAKIIVVAVFCLTANLNVSSAKFRVIREWNYVNFTWPDSQTYNRALEQELYRPENIIIAGLKYFDGSYYITLPRMKRGVPVTLGRIHSGLTNDTAPLFSPFPSWEMNELGNCDVLQNVQNVEIDPMKGHMWIIDGGRTETLNNPPNAKCQPKLIVYDIRKMENVFTYTFPEHVASFNGSFLYDIVLDNTDQGYAYITDNGKDPGIIVFSTKDHHAWKIRHSQSMRADPNAAYFHVNNITVSATLNIASIALGPRFKNESDRIVVSEDRELFYAPLSSFHLYSISTSILRNEQFASQDGEYQGTVTDYGTKSSQSVGMVMDNRGVLYYSLLAVNSIARWDSNTPFQTGQRIIAKDERYLEWVNSFAFDDAGNLTILVNKLSKFIYGKLNLAEPNFRLIASHIGSKSYLYDEIYDYEGASTTEVSSTTTTEKESPILKPGMDQDPYMAPQPESKPEPEPQPEPTSSESSASTSETTTKAPDSGASQRSVMALFSLLTAGMLFVV